MITGAAGAAKTRAMLWHCCDTLIGFQIARSSWSSEGAVRAGGT